jgi:hypothetical protein
MVMSMAVTLAAARGRRFSIPDRSGHLFRAALADYGVRAVVDLRLPDELADRPNPFAEPGDHGIAYTNVSFADPAAAFPPDTFTLAENYLWVLDRFRGFVAQVMTAIARAPEGAVVIHCAAGDRTGLISALLLPHRRGHAGGARGINRTLRRGRARRRRRGGSWLVVRSAAGQRGNRVSSASGPGSSNRSLRM